MRRHDDGTRWFVPQRPCARRLVLTPIMLVGLVVYLGVGVILSVRTALVYWWSDLREVWR